MAKSIILSTKHWFEAPEEAPTEQQLNDIAARIRAGEPYAFSEQDIQRLLAEKMKNEQPWTLREKLQTGWFFFVILVVPLVVIILLLLRHMSR